MDLNSQKKVLKNCKVEIKNQKNLQIKSTGG
jgi:hypothetical protein